MYNERLTVEHAETRRIRRKREPDPGRSVVIEMLLRSQSSSLSSSSQVMSLAL